MANIIQAVRGTQDYYPEDMAVRSWLYAKMRQVSESFGYQEYDGPFLERFELYAAKSGAELVEKQSYVFEDRGGERITLRPELTPTLARMVATRQRQLTYPLRWWSFGPFWRYEKPQKGRTREFFQWNIDMVGEDSPEADAELATIAATFLKAIGLNANETQILVNNRQLMQAELEALGIAGDLRSEVFGLIDRKDKLSAEAWQERGKELGLDAAQMLGLEKLLGNLELWQKSESMQRFFKAVEAQGAADYVRYAPHIIRGLDYYTGTVFEAWDTAGEFRAIFGGGRYNDLVNAVGGDPVPAVGFAVGNVVISLLLQALGHAPDVSGRAPIYVTVFDADGLAASLTLASELRAAGLKVTSHLQADKLQKQFKQADRSGARVVLVLGPDELAQKTVSVKDLLTGDQRSMARADLAAELGKLLA
ncbi:MAG: histidine--tRNA ligase [Anaerolineales bacterium]|nr:MAG: histidine--tRNA ligase [Anaerolineales bacterium]